MISELFTRDGLHIFTCTIPTRFALDVGLNGSQSSTRRSIATIDLISFWRDTACETLFCPGSLDILAPLLRTWPFGGPQLPNAPPPQAQPVPDETFPAPNVDPEAPDSRSPAPSSGQAPNKAPLIDPQIEILKIESDPETQNCQAIASSSNPYSQSGQGYANSHGCEKATQRLVFPLSCEYVSKNIITEGIISGMDPGYKTLRDPACRVQDGVDFWLGWFTPEQVKALRGDGAVRAIISNLKAKPDSLNKANVKAPSNQIRKPDTSKNNRRSRNMPNRRPHFGISNAPFSQKKSSYLDKRAPMSVIQQFINDPTLNFLSSAPGRNIIPIYSYSQPAGDGVVVIVLEPSLPLYLPDIDWTRTVSRGDDYKSSELDPEGDDRLLGRCTVDRIGGEQFGVAKKARFALYECGPDLDSFMSTMAQISHAIRLGRIAPAKNGFVMNARMRFEPVETEEAEFAAVMGERISGLITDGVIFVASAGADLANADESHVTAYPGKLSARLPIITVGFVSSLDGSSIGPQDSGEVTVFAPDFGRCLNYDTTSDYFGGPGIAVATVTGSVAYFLSLSDLAPRFGPPGVDRSRNVISHLQQLSHARFGGQQAAIWNGQDNGDSAPSQDPSYDDYDGEWYG